MSVQITASDEGSVGSPCLCQARLVAPDATGAAVLNEGNAVQVADVASISCTVYDTNSPQPDSPADTPAITTAAITALTADNQWSRLGQPIDSIGRNLLFTCPGTKMIVPGHTYWIVFKVVLNGASGSTLYAIFEHSATPVAP